MNMLFNRENTPAEAFENAIQELRRVNDDRRHPFCQMVLSTTGEKHPSSRYVILREVTDNLGLLTYTDSRSAKVREICASERVSLLFYHPELHAQIRIDGMAVLHQDNNTSKDHWENIPHEARTAYTSVIPPGEAIDKPLKNLRQTGETNPVNFTVIHIIPEYFDILQLNGWEHLRMYALRESGAWRTGWLSP